MQAQRSNRSFILGMFGGITLATGAAFMLGMQNGQPNTAKYEYFTTSAGGTAARLWRRPIDKEQLEYVGDFAAVLRGP